MVVAMVTVEGIVIVIVTVIVIVIIDTCYAPAAPFFASLACI